jgi:hypothetical protein
MMRRSFLLAIALIAAEGPGAYAQPVYKCSVDGKTTYADRPCERGASSVLPPPAAGADASLGRVHTGDARTLLELEKLRAAREKRELVQEHADRKAARSASLRRQHCARLRLRVKWADEDVARLHGKAQGEAEMRARLRARRQRETLGVECPG